MKTLFTIDEAAKFLSGKSDIPMTADDVTDLIQQEKLPICIAADGELFQVRIEHDGMSEEVKGQIPFNGVIRSLVPPWPDGKLTVSCVEVVRVDGIRYEYRDGNRYGVQFPTVGPYGGTIKPGFKVNGLVDFVDVPADNWRFYIDDLRPLIEPMVHEPDTDQPTSTEKKERVIGVPYKELIEGFKLDQTKWEEKLRRPDRRKKYESALCAPGARRKGASSTFNPAIFGALLIKNQEAGYQATRVETIIEKHFPSYRDEWAAERQELE